jgi:hypothetical protein
LTFENDVVFPSSEWKSKPGRLLVRKRKPMMPPSGLLLAWLICDLEDVRSVFFRNVLKFHLKVLVFL